MLGKIFKKGTKDTKAAASPAKAADSGPDDLIDEDKTIVIDLTSDEQVDPDEVRLQLDDAPSPVPASGTASQRQPEVRTAPAEPGDGDDTEVWTGGSPEEPGPVETPWQAAAGGSTALDASSSAEDEKSRRLIVGWLVVTSEQGRNMSYPVRLGRNKLGRGSGNTIDVQVGDAAISKDNHITLAADPKTQRFFAVPGDSTNLAYVNDEPLLGPQEITDKAVLQVGETVFVFLQFAGNYVAWE